MDVLTLLRSTRDDTIEPSQEDLSTARAALLIVATSNRPKARWIRRIATNWRWMPSHRGGAVAAAVLVSAVLLTGAAIVWQPSLWVGPDGKKVDGDVVLPVEYTTLSGESISCTYAAYLNPESGRTNLEAALSMLHSQDWTTFGEDVKQYALDNPFTKSGPEYESLDEPQREKIAFDMAAAAIVIERSRGLLPADTAILATSDCPGRVS